MTRIAADALPLARLADARDRAGRRGRAWEALGRTLPRPRAVLMVSAHWETSVPMLTGNPKPQTIHDFGGFPAELYALRYPAPGAPALATQAVALLKDAGITAGVDGCRGLDHGAWVPLLWMYPGARRAGRAALGAAGARHRASRRAGAALAPLAARRRADHRLRPHDAQPARLDGQPAAHRAAALRAGVRRLAAASGSMAHDTAALIAYREQAPEAARAHPTEEHFLPLHVAWGAAGDEPRVERSSTASRPARSRWIRTRSIPVH